MKWAGLMVAMTTGVAHAQAPLIGPWPTPAPTEVVVLGTPHLSGIKQLRPEWADPLVDRLARWKPKVITIEALSGPECFLLRAYEKSWPDTADSYCSRVEKVAAAARQATGLDMPAAEAAAEEAVAKLAGSSTAADHRRLAALFAAAGNLGSAATQWLTLAASERRAGDGVDTGLATALNELSALKNENYWVAAALAARLGLPRIYPVDDHLSDRIQAEAPPGLGAALRKIWSGTPPPLAAKARERQGQIGSAASLLDYYRFLNRDDVGEASVRADMGKAYTTPSPGQHGRRYVGWWEARNLRMIANIRSALAVDPGARALVVVGSTHKPYFDAYLKVMHEVRVVPTAQVLGK